MVPGDPRRATGIHANAAMRLDPVLKNTGLVDLTGGSARLLSEPGEAGEGLRLARGQVISEVGITWSLQSSAGILSAP